MPRLLLIVLVLTPVLLLWAVASADYHGHDHEHDQPANPPGIPVLDGEQAVCVLVPTAGNDTAGVITFTPTADGMRIVADVTGLRPNSRHGFHIHAYGDMRSADGSAMGGHYNPHGHPHDLPDGHGPRHAGDLGNLEADETGRAHYDAVMPELTILGGGSPIAGRGVIVHALPDDGGQPTGNAGPRIAQGVIGVTNPG